MTEIRKPDLDAQCFVTGDSRLTEIARAGGMTAEGAAALAQIDTIMHRIRRNLIRRDFGRQVLARVDAELDVGHLDVIGAIETEDAADPAEVTVGHVAERLEIDPSRASRLVAEVVERGYARRVASQQDARRICLELTEKGKHFIRSIRETKWGLFSKALKDWDEEELIVFARLLDRFSNWTRDGLAAEGIQATQPQAISRSDTAPAR